MMSKREIVVEVEVDIEVDIEVEIEVENANRAWFGLA